MLVKTRTLSFGAFACGAGLGASLDATCAPLLIAPFAALPFAAVFAALADGGFFPRAASYTSYCRYRCWSCVKTCVMLGTSSVWFCTRGCGPLALFAPAGTRWLPSTTELMRSGV